MKWTGMIYQEINLDYGFMILFKKITKLLLNSSNGIIVIIIVNQMKRKNYFLKNL